MCKQNLCSDFVVFFLTLHLILLTLSLSFSLCHHPNTSTVPSFSLINSCTSHLSLSFFLIPSTVIVEILEVLFPLSLNTFRASVLAFNHTLTSAAIFLSYILCVNDFYYLIILCSKIHPCLFIHSKVVI